MGGLSSNSMTSTDSPTNNSLHNHNHSHNTNIPHATTPAHARACAEAVPRQRCEAVQLQLLQELQLECVRTLRHMVRRIDARKLVLAPGSCLLHSFLQQELSSGVAFIVLVANMKGIRHVNNFGLEI